MADIFQKKMMRWGKTTDQRVQLNIANEVWVLW